MVWCGVVWCGVVWCGVVWCGVWCGVGWGGVVCGRPLSHLPVHVHAATLTPACACAKPGSTPLHVRAANPRSHPCLCKCLCVCQAQAYTLACAGHRSTVSQLPGCACSRPCPSMAHEPTNLPGCSSAYVHLGAHHIAVWAHDQKDTIVPAVPILQQGGRVCQTLPQHLPQLLLLVLAIWLPLVPVHKALEKCEFVVVHHAILLLRLHHLCVCRLDGIAPTCHSKKLVEASTSTPDLSLN